MFAHLTVSVVYFVLIQWPTAADCDSPTFSRPQRLDNSRTRTYRESDFSDLSPPVFRNRQHIRTFTKTPATVTNAIAKQEANNSDEEQTTIAGNESVPIRVNWHERGFVSSIRSQGACGACWAHSVISVIETMFAIGTPSTPGRPLIELSAQQMVECASPEMGCNGGNICGLLDWLVQNNVSIALRENYPDQMWQEPCKTNQPGTVTVKGFKCLNLVNRETDLIQYLARTGPAAVAVNSMLWSNYLGGVIRQHCDGSVHDVNHAVTVVGYDLTPPQPHYIVRNSWGHAFGNDGYAKIAYNQNMCGIANQVVFIEL